jgi:antirestriction protein
MTKDIDELSRSDIFDSREVMERITELQDQEERDPDEDEELTDLLAFEQDQGAADWSYGEAFIADDHFTEYAEQLADDIGAIDGNASWPLTHIDWDAAAKDLKMDYSSVELRGVTFWYRS